MNARPPGSTPFLRLQSVGKTFANGTRALAGFDLDVRRGEFVALLGPSGCGKSTVLRLVAGLSQPSSGTLTWCDEQGGTAAGRRNIGFVFQDPTLMPWATVAANVALPLRLTGVSRAVTKPRIAEFLARVGLAGFAGALPRELSGGMRMRVAIARALATDPDILLMDEPFAALDEITRFKLNNDLVELWQTFGKTILFVTHSVFEAVYLAQRIIVMTPRPGRIFTAFAVDAPYPRGDDFRMSPGYAETCRKVAAALSAAMVDAA
ncbi:MAG: ABC transporter ATP-binding protein [Xanthobacteraceae bacterium]